ncbi:hypothetical protein D9619_011947 [Psilocybe cf. subviscida]|uniref:DUF6534 domain-containing protein n=1 Tax=Psilocybe cf. subviscida TaxID=2480587 RepID=A0A8H5EVR0_9AGAR|nr:hypothetical protein D9619_011947 [Psilocybe cf. subviscida]
MAPISMSAQTVDIDNTAGVLLLSLFGASFIYGITTLQAYWYYHSYPNDSRVNKTSVAALWLLDGFHLALVMHAVYRYLVTGFGDSERLFSITWSLRLQNSVYIIIVLVVHALYASRVWFLSGYHGGFLGYFVALVVLGGFGVGVGLSYLIYTIPSFHDLEKISWAITAALGTSTAIDFVIAASMCYYLSKSKGSLMRLNSRISTIMQYTLSSGLLTSACSISAMFTYLLLPNTFVFLGLLFFATKIYVGSYVALLNSRERNTAGMSWSNGSEHSDLEPAFKRPSNRDTRERQVTTGTSSLWGPAPTLSIINSFPSPPPMTYKNLEVQPHTTI